jgi:two-component system response regulator YesN
MNILVVEDEPLSLEDLIGMLQTFADAHQVVGCASGAEALACAEASAPDLVITDIRMPEIDGLELIQRLKAHTPQLAAIVLSGHSEFEYARMGLRLGIADYLLKPVRVDVLHQAVARALDGLAAARTHATHVREAELARLLLGGQRAASGEPNLLAGDWGVIVLICENWNGPAIWRDTPIDRAFITRTLAGDATHGWAVVDVDARCRLVLLPLAGPQLHVLDTLAQRLYRAILAAGVLAHITYIHKGADQRPERAVPEGLTRLGQAMRFAGPTFVRPGDMSEESLDSSTGTSEQLVGRALAEGRVADAVTELHATLARLQRDGATQAMVIQTVAGLFRSIQQHARALPDRALPGREAITAVVHACRTYAELERWVDTQLQALLSQQRGAATPRQLARALVALVHSAYAEEISLQTFAAEHGVSLAYFSRLFKDEVGITFSDYLTRVRIEKAKDLLTRRDLRLSDISTLVGYEDPKYFSQIFRKIVGVAPLDYQRSRDPSALHASQLAEGRE